MGRFKEVPCTEVFILFFLLWQSTLKIPTAQVMGQARQNFLIIVTNVFGYFCEWQCIARLGSMCRKANQ